MDADGKLCRSLALIRERSFVVRACDLTDELLEMWTADDVVGTLPGVTAARYAPQLIFDLAPDDRSIALRGFIYTYERYCEKTFCERCPGRWLDERAELRFVQFQYLLRMARLARLARGGNRPFPPLDLFDYGNYNGFVEVVSAMDDLGFFDDPFPALFPSANRDRDPN